MADEPIVTVRDIYQLVTALSKQVTAMHGQITELCNRMDSEADRNKEWRADIEDKVREVKKSQNSIRGEIQKLWKVVHGIQTKVYGFTAALSFLGLLVGILTTFDGSS